MDNVECLKTCCGALAILAKDEANKLLIARDGTRLILSVMEAHATRPDLQVFVVFLFPFSFLVLPFFVQFCLILAQVRHFFSFRSNGCIKILQTSSSFFFFLPPPAC